MSIYLFICVPLAWAAIGKLLEPATAALFFYSDAGKRRGRALGRWCIWLLPVAYLVLVIAGAGGNAGHGVTLFGSETLFTILCGLPLYAAPILAVAAGIVYVVRDLTLGHGVGGETRA